jgi:subtilisin inhibitor-like
MRRTITRTVLAAVGAAAVLAPSGAAQAASTTGYSATSNTRLSLSISPAEAGTRRATWLTCDPARGNHPKAARACKALAAAGGNPAAIGDREGVCPMVYAPVTVRATGRWRGKAVRYRETFGNGCVMDLGTDALFQF